MNDVVRTVVIFTVDGYVDTTKAWQVAYATKEKFQNQGFAKKLLTFSIEHFKTSQEDGDVIICAHAVANDVASNKLATTFISNLVKKTHVDNMSHLPMNVYEVLIAHSHKNDDAFG